MFFLQAKIVCRSHAACEKCSKMVCSSTFTNNSVRHSILWCFVSAMNRNTQDSSPIVKQMGTCGTVWQIWVSLHNLSRSVPEAHLWDSVEQTSYRSPSFQYLQVNMINSLLIKVQLLLQQKWRPRMVVWPPVYKLLQLFLYWKQLTADHYLITFKVLVSLSKSFKLLEEMHMRQLHFHEQLKWFQPFLELRQLFPEAQDRTSSFTCCDNGEKHNLSTGLIWMQWLG